MPDWMSHILIGLIFAELFSVRKKSLVLLGALLPDMASKLFLLFFYLGFWDAVSFESFHTPLMSFLLAVVLSPLFRYGRVKTILFISAGVMTHLLSDLTMRHFDAGIRLFFPFSAKVYTFNLIWPEQSIYIIFPALAVYLLIRAVKKVCLCKRGI